MANGTFAQHANPYLDQYANQPIFGAKKAKNYWGSILGAGAKGDFSQMPGMGVFDNQIASGYKDIENSSDPLAYLAAGESGGAMGDRNEELQKERLRQGVNSQRYGFAQEQLGNAAQGLAVLAAMKNSATNSKYGTLIGGENQRYQYEPPKPGFWGQLGGSVLGGLFSGAGAAGGFGKLF